MTELATCTYQCDRCGHTIELAPREVAPDAVTLDVPRCVATQLCAIEMLAMRRLVPRPPS